MHAAGTATTGTGSTTNAESARTGHRDPDRQQSHDRCLPGSSDTTTLLELKATVTDSTGKIQTKSAGDHLSTSPLKFGATIPLTGTFTGNSHVVVTGYFLDGSQKLMLDTTL